MYHNSYSNIYLAHYGVKGMKWGVRRYRNEDGSLTALGQKKYEYQQAKKAPGRKDSAEIAFRKREFKDQKIREKIANQKSKSKRQMDLENKYLKEGFTKDEASIQAYKRIRADIQNHEMPRPRQHHEDKRLVERQGGYLPECSRRYQRRCQTRRIQQDNYFGLRLERGRHVPLCGAGYCRKTAQRRVRTQPAHAHDLF